MATTTLSTIEQRLAEDIGDWISVASTTNITTNNYIYSTNLNEFDRAQDDAFPSYWVFIKGTTNDEVERKVKEYTTTGGRVEVYGAALVAETAARTVVVTRFNHTAKLKAIQRSLHQVYPLLHKDLDNITLITGNILPNAHFDDQTTGGTPDKWAYSASATGAAETTIIWNGAKSVKVTSSAANQYLYLTSATQRRLLDLMGKTIGVRVMAYPEVADDATIVIYTKQADGTTQTLTSTTSCPAGAWTRLELESQTLNDDLVLVEIRLKIATSSKYVYFDDAQLDGYNASELLLPLECAKGNIQRYYIQTSGYSDDTYQDLHPRYWTEIEPPKIIDDGTDKYLWTGILIDKRRLRLIGYQPLETLTAQTDTITIDAEKLDMLIAKAKQILFERASVNVSSEDRKRYKAEAYDAYLEYLGLSSAHSMATCNIKLRSE